MKPRPKSVLSKIKEDGAQVDGAIDELGLIDLGGESNDRACRFFKRQSSWVLIHDSGFGANKRRR